MTKKVEKVLLGYINLSQSEKEQFIKGIKDYEDKSDWRKKDLKESLEKSATRMTLGPIENVCPCCGR